MEFNLKLAISALILGTITTFATAETSLITDVSKMALECRKSTKSLAKTGDDDAYQAAHDCMEVCRGAGSERSIPEKDQNCRVFYSDYRAASGQSVPEKPVAISEPFHVDSLTAQFSVRNGRVNQFRLIPAAQTSTAQLAAERCFFKLSDESIQSISGRISPERRKKLEEIRANNQFAAYKLYDINWVEDGTRTKYECSVGYIEIVGINKN